MASALPLETLAASSAAVSPELRWSTSPILDKLPGPIKKATENPWNLAMLSEKCRSQS